MYQAIYELIMEHVYAGVPAVTGDMTLTATVLATCACVFLISLPFLLVWRFVRMFV